jgi:bifunctional DNase/RNase
VSGELLKVIDIEAYVNYSDQFNPYTVLQCSLEDGRLFNLYLIPLEVVLAVNKIKGYGFENDRETLFEVLTVFDEIEVLRNKIEKVVVDEVDENTHLYTAKIYIKGDGFTVAKRMIPSHAIFLAYLVGAPIYISKELVDKQEQDSKETEEDSLGF